MCSVLFFLVHVIDFLVSLTVENSFFNGRDCVAGIGGVIENCVFKGIINGERYSGGIVGSNQGEVIKYRNEGDAEVNCIMGGGVVGQNQGYGCVRQCVNMGFVTGKGDALGSVVGQCDGIVDDCYYLQPEEVNPALNGIGNLTGEYFSKRIHAVDTKENLESIYQNFFK